MGNSKIRDNYNLGSVGDFLKDNLKKDCKIDIVSAYFTIHAYHKLKQQLGEIESMRFLFGEPTFIKGVDTIQKNHRSYKIEYDRAEEQLKVTMRTKLTQKKIAKECYDWLETKAEIKSMVKPNFLHGKMYHIKHKTGTEKAIVGSSNFTVSGLGFGNHKHNIELNLIVDSDTDREDLGEWFKGIWTGNTDIIQDVKKDVLNYLSQFYAENSPEFIYYKTLFHIFDKFLDSQNENDFEISKNLLDSQIWNSLYEFQKIGVKGALNRIKKNGGCIIADSVGLGKTYEALAIIKEFELRNKQVLVICPKKLSSNWTIFQAQQNHILNPFKKDKFQYHILYNTDMGRTEGKSGANAISFENINWSIYDLVVVDESHNFKGNPKRKIDKNGNQKLNRSAWLLEEIIKKGTDTKVLLLSATPVNTTLKDLRNQMSLIAKGSINGEDSALCKNTGIADIEQLLKTTQTHFTTWADVKNEPNRKLKDLLEKIDSGFFKLLDELTIARSRNHIIKAYSETEIGKFPEKLKPKPIYSKIDSQNEFPTYDKINIKILEYKLSIFNPSKYLKKDDAVHKKYAEKANANNSIFTQEDREKFLIGMMKINFLKRLESSINSFAVTLERTIQKIENLTKEIESYKKYASSESEFEIDENLPEDEQDEEYEDLDWQVGKKLKFDLKDLRLDDWLNDLENDKKALELLYNKAKAVVVERDSKLAELKNCILKKQSEPINATNKKVLVFTAFADTAKYLYNSLIAFAKENNLHIALVTGDLTATTFGDNEFERILTNFSPVSKNRSNFANQPINQQIDILIATDCISEGQNLQDCDTVINYDIHWNPIRIIQRFGRIDRLKSKNEKIQLINFWPTEDLEKYINLKNRVETRMALGNLTATGDDDPLDNPDLQIQVQEGELKFREKQLIRLKDEVLDIEEFDDFISLTDFTLEDFRMEISGYLASNREKLETSPLGMYAIVPKAEDSIKPGVIYCLKQKNDSKENEKINPTAPYFLIYIKQDGTVRYNYMNIKQILDMYRSLCFGVKNPYQDICNIFNKETNDGENMDVYAELVQKAVKEITSVYRKKSAIGLTNNRKAVIAPIENQIHNEESFELITWLVIK
jgi:superfamily II DNA or RNA helicase